MGTPARFYSSVAPLMTLQAGVNSAATTITVDTTAGLPASTPFTVTIDKDQVNQEIVDVTGVSGNNLTIVRGVDGTVPIDHTAGAEVEHDISARDHRESREHEAATTGVHGVVGDVVGSDSTVVLTNKSISGTNNTLTNIPGAQIVGAASVIKSVLPTDVVYLTTAQTLTNKTLTSPLGIVKGDVGLGNVDNTSNATERAAAATLTNKTINGANNTLTVRNADITSLDAASKLTGLVPKANLPTDTVYGTDVTVSGASAVDNDTNFLDNGTIVKYNLGLRRVTIYVNVALSVSSITANANGGVTDVSTVTLVAGLAAIKPPAKVYGVGEYNGVQVGFYIDTAGHITLYQGSPNLVINSGTPITASLSYTY